MSRILLRSAQDPAVVLPAAESLRRMGGNAGNLLYAHAVHRALSVEGTQVETGAFDLEDLADPRAWAEDVNARYDRFVIPMSNAFRATFTDDLERLAAAIELLDVPVTVVGVGAQTTLGASDGDGPLVMGRTGASRLPGARGSSRHDAVVRRFVDAVLERSASIGVRGGLTRRYLEGLGVDAGRIDVIGCPSLFTWGPDLHVRPPRLPLRQDARISLNVDHRVAGVADLVELNAARYPRLTVAVQDFRSMCTVVHGVDEFDMTTHDARLPIHTGHPLYAERRMLFHPNPWGWIETLGHADLVVGTRLHGNIAGILGGTPAHLLVHDSRTLELAEYHAIPFTRIDALDGAPDVAELAERTDYGRFDELHPVRFATYLDFLRRNELETVFDDGRDATAFDASIARGRSVGPVRPSVTFLQKVRRRLARRWA